MTDTVGLRGGKKTTMVLRSTEGIESRRRKMRLLRKNSRTRRKRTLIRIRRDSTEKTKTLKRGETSKKETTSKKKIRKKLKMLQS